MIYLSLVLKGFKLRIVEIMLKSNVVMYIRLALSCGLLIATMTASLWFVVQNDIWFAPPHLYNAVHIKLWILFSPLPVLLVCMFLSSKVLSINLVGILVVFLLTIYVGCSLFAFAGYIVSRSIPHEAFCKLSVIDHDSNHYTCTVRPWISSPGEYIYTFEHQQGSLFMYVIDRKWKQDELGS